ncbi:MAG: carboxylating nicotinate-nucleotide diphosphorylase [Candidatus Magasanikiibacteriota bacterium]
MTKKQTIQKYFNQKEKLKLSNPTYKKQVKFLTDWFLAEDLGDRGDITSDLIIKHNSPTTAIVMAKENGIIAGLEEITWILTKYKIHITKYKKDGDSIKKGQQILQIKGKIKDILKLERTILNILQRMSGIATQTNKIVKFTHNKVLICPTRKTQWGLLDKKAVTLGGGSTHRLGLHDWILIKDNHIKFINYSLFLTPYSFFEIECKTEQQVWEFLGLKPGAIMLDNMKPEQIKKLVPQIKTINPNLILEASGGINETNISKYAKTGVDIISIGALTHSIKSLDISLDIC